VPLDIRLATGELNAPRDGWASNPPPEITCYERKWIYSLGCPIAWREEGGVPLPHQLMGEGWRDFSLTQQNLNKLSRLVLL